MNIKQYQDVEHPFHLPGGVNLLKWSIPFVIEKIGQMMDELFNRT